MRILFLTTVYPSPRAPTFGMFNRNRVAALRSMDEVCVIAPVPWTWCLRRQGNAVPSDSLGSEGQAGKEATLHPTYYYPPRMLRSHYGWFMWHSVRRKVRAVWVKYRPEVVLSYWAHPDGEAAVRAARAGGVPVGLIVGGSDLLLLTRDPRRRRAVVDVLSRVDAVFTVGAALAARASELGLPPDRIHELRQGVDPARFSPGDPDSARKRLGFEPGVPLLLFVGNLLPVKGLEVLLEAAGRLARQGTAFELWVVGAGPLRCSLETRAAQEDLRGRVRFFGARPQEELPDFFRAADLTVLASHSEGVPNVLRESLACGTPFVATRVGSIAEIATPDCELVTPGDPGALSDAIAKRLGGPLVKRSVAPFTWQDLATQIRSVLARLIEQHPPRA